MSGLKNLGFLFCLRSRSPLDCIRGQNKSNCPAFNCGWKGICHKRENKSGESKRVTCDSLQSDTWAHIFLSFFFFSAFICKIKRQFCSNTRALWDTHCLFLVDDLCTRPGRLSFVYVCVCVLAWLTPAHLRSAQNKTVCLSFRDNVADWQRSSKATIRELFSAAGEQETRGGHCFHSVGLARLPCNNQQAGRLRAREEEKESWKRVMCSHLAAVFWEKKKTAVNERVFFPPCMFTICLHSRFR